MKKQVFIILALMLISISSIAQTFNYNGINYQIKDTINNTACVAITNLSSNLDSIIVIPEIVYKYNNLDTNSYTVVGIDTYAFQCWGQPTSMRYINLPNTLIYINSYAFESCVNLDSIIIPNSVRYIGEWAFGDCNRLRSVTLPNYLDTIRSAVFLNCNSLSYIKFGTGLSYIGIIAFQCCDSLRSIQLPANGTIADSAFFNCFGLTDITFYQTENSEKNNNPLILKPSAFSTCSALTNIFSKTDIPPIITDNTVFDGIVTSNVNLHVCDTVVYGNSDWSSFNIQYDTTICHSLSLADIENDINLSVYPNPTIDYIDIMVNNNDKSLAYFYDINGKKIKSFSFRGYYRLDTSDLNNGIYLLKIGNATKKIVK